MSHAIKATAHEIKIRRVAYFYSAAERRSRGALWPSFALALIPGPMADDINTMHRYRDAIVLPKVLGGAGYDKGVVKDAVVLFPYRDQQAYRDHRFFKSIDAVQIGGLPFLPGATTLLEGHLENILAADGIIVPPTNGQGLEEAALGMS